MTDPRGNLLLRARHAVCSALGYVLFMPLALVTHLVWGIYGMLAYPLALMGCDARAIKEPYVLVVGPMYVSSKLGRSWAYYGCEPESADGGRLVIDQTFALRWWARNQALYSENLRGNESKRLPPNAAIVRK